MGFMDKAKKMAEQAQTKLDEVQKQFNEGQSGAGREQPPVEYDQHGRPVGPPPAAPTPPHGDPLAEQPAAPPPPPPPAPAPDPAAPDAERKEDEPKQDEPKEDDPYAPPKLSGGDPLAG
jgi:hypothetical protein